ncbi:MAG: nucleoside hydrolase [Sulfobacillus thermosulfidooxidans]|nr:MAG: nucleoside hydrolase [Sulfobacillus thermosulfidooxidans]
MTTKPPVGGFCRVLAKGDMNAPMKRVILDMDPGIDDALALIIALKRFDVLRVCTVGGNVKLEDTYQNARFLLEQAGRSDITVWAGASRPLFYPLIKAAAIHGGHGLGLLTDIPKQRLPEDRAWTELAALAHQDVGPMHLISTGPLTNLALLFLAHPDLATRWTSITCMFGALPGTHVDRFEEFNVYLDPHAADVVLRYGENVQLIGINVAHRALLPLKDVQRFRQYGRIGQLLFELMTFYGTKSQGEGGDPEAFPIDDVLTIAAVDAPDLFQWVELPLAVVREGPLRGTVVVAQGPADRPLCKIASSIDVDAFLNWLWQSFA